jgi:hypothetical protein
LAWNQVEQKQQQRDRKVEPKAKAVDASLTGCVDEQEGGRYILIDPKSLAPLASLEAVGFPNEGFAKHLGNTIIVKGSLDSGPKPVMRVRTIETVSNGCGTKQ